MTIKKLIKTFEKLLTIYEKAYNEKYSYDALRDKNIMWGLCHASYINVLHNFNLFDLFNVGEYYGNLVKKSYLFPQPKSYKDLKYRIDFMKSEIKSLNKLLKKGYTHV